MKKFVRLVCMMLACSLLLAVPAKAAAEDTRASIFFSSYGVDLDKTSSTSFDIWYDVTANAAIMDVLGVSEILLYKSADAQSWQEIKMYSMNAYAGMVAYNTTSHDGYVSYNFATPGYYYTAYVTFYATNSRGIGERYVYTEILRM